MTLLFFLLSLAVFRVWRLVGRDDISGPLRLRLPDKVRKPVECPWCAGSWLSIGATYAVHRWLVVLPHHWALWAAAVAGIVGFLGEIDARLQR